MDDNNSPKITKRSQADVDAALAQMHGNNSSFFSIFRILYNIIAPMLKRILSLDFLRNGALDTTRNLTHKEDIPTALSRPHDYEGKQ